jgi:hypothetical protein
MSARVSAAAAFFLRHSSLGDDENNDQKTESELRGD